MPFRLLPSDRRNVKGVIYPFTAALLFVYGSREKDGGRSIGDFYEKTLTEVYGDMSVEFGIGH